MSPDVTVQVSCARSPAFRPGGNTTGDSTGGDTTVICTYDKGYSKKFAQAC